jgi:hypothetical protein
LIPFSRTTTTNVVCFSCSLEPMVPMNYTMDGRMDNTSKNWQMGIIINKSWKKFPNHLENLIGFSAFTHLVTY